MMYVCKKVKRCTSLPDSAFQELSKCLLRFDSRVCCNQILKRYNLFTDAYHILGWGYRYLLTLPVTQVACERSFTVLKHIKSRIRSKQSQEHLEAFMLMTTEKDILMSLDNDLVIDRVAEKATC